MAQYTPAWKLLSQPTLSEVVANSVPRKWPPGTIIFRQHGCCLGLHILEIGRVKLYVTSGAAREQTICILAEVGPLTLLPLLDGGPYAVSARALALTRTRFLPIQQFERLCNYREDFAKAVRLEMAAAMRKMISVTDSIALKPVFARVSCYVLEHAREAEALQTGTSFRLPLSQEELAHLAGTTRESVARALADLRKAGIIEQQRSTIRILDAVRLAQWSECHVCARVPAIAAGAHDDAA